ncbi:threonine aldolase family protein [Halocatena pleomorpha]|uniref:Low specificity L-threonine aldolase n=1 Tax=Halocatena pleomorpha TaxID=1785090 RepID=A0A3P3RIY2_9EURY|nr:low specificity L-threonine aldolase [Halocatena pleomorpha]RRJ33486.1 low specificity L-threonine aldolase [Halocatena pleomorpha]
MIDLRSDTVTRPSDAMRESARDATVGDDVYREDPTVNELERRAAERLGMAAALFVPSGTMGNQVAARTHTERGQEILLERNSHIYRWELAGLAQHGALQTRPLDGTDRGVLTPETVRDGVVSADGHRPGTGLLALENTHNAAGGTALAPGVIDATAQAAHDHGVPVHLDGARLGNAAVAQDVPLSRMTREVDSVMLCLSKGLGAPVGSVLAGSEAFIDRARRVRKLLGGGLRQAGIIAAPGLRALENVDRLVADHENASLLADSLSELSGLSVQEPETNIVLVETERTAEAFLDRCSDVGVGGVAFDDHLVRFTTHWDVDRDDIETAVDRIATVC